MEHKQDERKVDSVSQSNQVQGGREWSDATERHDGKLCYFSFSKIFHVSRFSFKGTSKPSNDKLLQEIGFFLLIGSKKTTC